MSSAVFLNGLFDYSLIRAKTCALAAIDTRFFINCGRTETFLAYRTDGTNPHTRTRMVLRAPLLNDVRHDRAFRRLQSLGA
jgi:hypothetical protein